MGEESRQRSMPRMRWMDQILAMTKLSQAELKDVSHATQDGVRWKWILNYTWISPAVDYDLTARQGDLTLNQDLLLDERQNSNTNQKTGYRL